MSTLIMSGESGRLWPPIDFDSIRDAMRNDRAVVITAIIVGGIVACVMLVLVGYLIFVQRDTGSMLSLINMLLTAVLWSKVSSVQGTVAPVATQTNGTQQRLIDAAIAAPAGRQQ